MIDGKSLKTFQLNAFMDRSSYTRLFIFDIQGRARLDVSRADGQMDGHTFFVKMHLKVKCRETKTEEAEEEEEEEEEEDEEEEEEGEEKEKEKEKEKEEEGEVEE